MRPWKKKDVVAATKHDEPNPAAAFYPMLPDCQIPDLSYLYERYLGRKTNGAFVEVGAFDGRTVSNTWGLAELGWRGLYIEASPKYAAKCRANHAEHPRVEVVTLAVSNLGGATMILHEAGPLSTTDSAVLAAYESISWARPFLESTSIEVPTVRLDDAVNEWGSGDEIDVLVVDVEGAELDVLESFDFSRTRPKVVVVELTDHHPDLRLIETGHSAVRTMLHRYDYICVYSDCINSFFVGATLIDEQPTV